MSLPGNGGEVPSQTPQRIICIKEARSTTDREASGLRHTCSLSLGLVTLKASATVRVLARMEETATVNTIAKVVWWRRQVVAVSRPKKSKEQRAQKVKEVRSK
jgi:hypothetical protein